MNWSLSNQNDCSVQFSLPQKAKETFSFFLVWGSDILPHVAYPAPWLNRSVFHYDPELAEPVFIAVEIILDTLLESSTLGITTILSRIFFSFT